MRVVVIDCGSGNLASAERALGQAAGRAGVDADIAVSSDPQAVLRADRLVLPGQGAFATCANGIAATPGLRDAIERSAAPFLGICVGMQLMAERGLENVTTPGFGWVKGEVARLAAPGLRLPQMGWNALEFRRGAHPLLDGVAPGDHVYFVHSYGLRGYAEQDVLATTDYGAAVAALVVRGRRAGTQFHVEKSQEVGLRILANFLLWTPGPDR